MRKDVKDALDAMIDKVLAYQPPRESQKKRRRSTKKRAGKK